MIREIRTLYVALIIMVSRKIYYWARNNEEKAVLSFQDNFTQDIRFNPPPESIPSGQSSYERLFTTLRCYYDFSFDTTWPEFLFEALFLFGTVSTAWQ
ncbi:hypothetical protein BpHYR1_034790, partial [Brachionus plicatilis]